MERKNISKAGFTIIELVVVIAIIAVLAAIVMVNVTQYIGQARDATIRADLVNLMTAGAVYYQNPPFGTIYQFFCTISGPFINPTAAAIQEGILNAKGAFSCYVGPSPNYATWCACSPSATNPGTKGFCVDSNGINKEITVGIGFNCVNNGCNTATGLCR